MPPRINGEAFKIVGVTGKCWFSLDLDNDDLVFLGLDLVVFFSKLKVISKTGL